MKRIILALALSIITTFLCANTATTTLGLYGYKDVSINGVSGETSFFIKLEDNYDVKKSTLHLNLLYSQALNRSLSYLNVLIDDQPVFSSLLNTLGSTLDIPLEQHIVDNKEYLKVTLKTSLSITGDNCRDMFSHALWMKVQSTSYIDWALNNTVGKKNEKTLWENLMETTVIVYPDDYDEYDMRAVSYLYTFIKTQTDNNIEIYPYSQLPVTEKKFLILGQIEKIPDNLKKHMTVKPTGDQGLIYSYHTSDTSSVNQVTIITGGDLKGYRRAYDGALNENLVKSIFSNYALLNNYTFKRDTYRFGPIKLSQLNNDKEILSGTGSLFATYNFSAGDFGGYSGDGNIHLEAKYRPVSAPSHAYYNVYLNQLLIYTHELHQDGQVIADVPFYHYQLMKNNTLTIEFLYFPGSGDCNAGSDVFYAQIDSERSGLEVNVVKNSKHLSFNTFPYLFYSVNTKMFISKHFSPERVKAVAEVMYEFNKNTYKDRFYYPEIFFSDDLTDDEISKNGIIAILSHNDVKAKLFTKSLAKVGENFTLYNNSTGEMMFQLIGNDNKALAQMFYQSSDLPVLLITDQGTDPNSLSYLAKVLSLNIADPNSNICVADSSRYFYFNVDESTTVLAYDNKLSYWDVFWRRYKIGILVLGIMLLGGSLMFIQRKSKRSTQSIKDTRS